MEGVVLKPILFYLLIILFVWCACGSVVCGVVASITLVPLLTYYEAEEHPTIKVLVRKGAVSVLTRPTWERRSIVHHRQRLF